MSDRSVLLVGLSEEQARHVGVPPSSAVTRVTTVTEALDVLELAFPDLIVTNEHVGGIDSLDFFQEVIRADPARQVPVVFLPQQGSGVLPFVYESRPKGFWVNYLDGSGATQTLFVREPADRPDVAVRSLRRDRLTEELTGLLQATGMATPVVLDPWEIGFGTDVAREGTTYHVQTEVVSVDPLTAVTMAFAGGSAVHQAEAAIAASPDDLVVASREIENHHAAVVAAIRSGELP